MNKKVCQWFKTVWDYFPDELDSDENYKFAYGDQNFKKYCTSNSCDSNFKKINAACLYLFNAFFGNSFSFKDNAKNNIDVVNYIIIWLSYMLSLKKENGINKLNDFYTEHIEKNTHYNQDIRDVSDYKNYKDLIEKKKDLLNMDINNNIISELYDAFKSLYEMYSAFGDIMTNCKKCSDKANKFVEKYKKLNGNPSITSNSPYNQALFTLLTDYNKLKDKCKDDKDSNFPTLPEIKTSQIPVKGSEEIVQNSDVTSSSLSIVSKLIPILSIFGAISIFLGISYKYSLFGFRKRSQKHLREKLKK
ncbi:uncharacterized protein PY17X_1000300 [Plasmodium yoelii]|uniref:Yir4 protein n=3 Tax=Plasmodium yoelii TaxID=5861 RepID=Q7RGZ2_PLAYO|nr:uncharacterized protein PY17X_1000300 [Plasmodium yoelii]EAA16026.1 putative yir4 protein [Plasmodium yoelii yoelii]WBY57723.1 PIR protein [Plasmodium yoelii yoelii]VTZ78740.1 PIR protein [Plasmodium yoelii]|eukprot:XP_724461.1 uncharacterized protein PY17X_1000300 [Plasmodium yoelii]